MVSEQQQRGRWLRIGALALTTFTPVLTGISSRFFRQAKEKNTYKVEEAPVALQEHEAASAEKLQVLGAALVDALGDFKTHAQPYRQELQRRSEQLAEAMRERGGEFSHQLAERSSQLTHDIAGRSAHIRKDLTKRSRRAARDLQGLTERKKAFWISLGFGVGLAAAGIVTFRLVRRRRKEHQAELLAELGYQDSHIELSPFSAQTNGKQAIGVQPTAAAAAPSDAVFLGVVSNKRYYPIETPLDQLSLPGDAPVDIVYFVSEAEAKEQGFSASR
jgi:hypothetical protein